MDGDGVDLKAVKRHFREFLRNYRQKQRYLYRDRLLRMHQRTSGDYSANATEDNDNISNGNSNSNTLPADISIVNNKASISVDLAHVGEYDTTLLDLILRQPALVMPTFESAAADALKSIINSNSRQQELDNANDDTNNNDNNNNEESTQDPQDPETNVNPETNNATKTTMPMNFKEAPSKSSFEET